MNKRTLSLSLAILALLITPLSFAAGNADQEIATATAHAQMAATAADTATAVMHMHHVINCLVGPKGKHFDAKAGDPCNGMGNGALNDVSHGSKEHAKLIHALALSERGVHAHKLDAAQHDATGVVEALKAVTPAK